MVPDGHSASITARVVGRNEDVGGQDAPSICEQISERFADGPAYVGWLVQVKICVHVFVCVYMYVCVCVCVSVCVCVRVCVHG